MFDFSPVGCFALLASSNDDLFHCAGYMGAVWRLSPQRESSGASEVLLYWMRSRCLSDPTQLTTTIIFKRVFCIELVWRECLEVKLMQEYVGKSI